jgi:hypothetical protein
MPESTLRLPIRPQSPPPRKKGGRRRRRPTAAVIVIGLTALAAIGAWVWWNGSVGSLPVREHCTATAGGKTTELDPEQAGNAALITAIANDRGLPARAASIGIATAIQESKLRNISYGDRDSMGLFQQRPSQGWGTREQIADPVYATNAFYDVLAKVDGFENMPITKVAQKVQRSAFPAAYADHEPEARIMASGLSGYSPGGFSCVLRPAATTAEQAGTDGLTARAKAVRRAAARETGRRDRAAAGRGGRALWFTVPASAGDRNAWGLASWAVARAGALNVVEVQVAGKAWTRVDSPKGWTTPDTPAATANQVLIVVA